MTDQNPKIPECVHLEAYGACSLKQLGATSSDDGRSVRLDFYDRQNQIFPIAMSANDLGDLLFVVGAMSQEMANKRKELGEKPEINIFRGRTGQELPPIRVRISWSPENQKATFIIGNAGLEIPMDADTAKSIGQSLVDIASPHSTSGPATERRVIM